MIFRKIFLSIVFLFSVTYFAACSCNCGDSDSQSNSVKGYIAVVGNEPFTKLAIQTDDNKTYILQCSKELHDELWKQQGRFYVIQYGDMRKEEGMDVLVVEKVIPVKKENKTK
ncbi:MAG: hypothetical protein M1391_18440 [Bacteroidetes bacterium]|nr:hypothetical protein [Bacteroidota bacterium]